MDLKSYLTKNRSTFNRYFTSILFVAAAFILIFFLEKFLGSQLRSLVLLATLLSAIHGGLGPGLLTGILGPVFIDLVIIEPEWQFVNIWVLFIRVSVYFVASILIAGLTSMLKRYLNEAEELREKAEEASKEKDGLMAIVAHDLKNPLNVIVGYNEMLKDKGCWEKMPDILEVINKNCESSLELIGKLQEYTQLGHGEYPFKTERFNLPAVVEELIKSSRILAVKKDINLNFICDDKEIFIEGDKGLVSRAIQNLIDNALKYSTPGKEVEISCSKENERALVHVADQGPGIAADEIKGLFKPFYKTSNVPTAKETSTGLGLSLVKSVAKMHKGDVAVESEKGKGSTFTIILPLAEG